MIKVLENGLVGVIVSKGITKVGYGGLYNHCHTIG